MCDAKLLLDDVTENLYRQIDALAPFGIDNPKPVFLFENVSVVRVEKFGKAKEHLKLVFLNRFGEISAISFFAADKCNVNDGDTVTAAAFIEKSYFGGRVELRLRLIDVV